MRGDREVLLLGVAGSGKTLLCRHLEHLCEGGHVVADLQAATVPSVGVELVNLRHHKDGLTLRECGGQMQEIWHRFLDEPERPPLCRPVLFVIDSSSTQSISSSADGLRSILAH